VHLSVFLKPSGKGKMSKRDAADLMKDGYSIFVKDMESMGYLPEAVINWISLMGWSYDDHTELFGMKDLIEKFNLAHLNPAPAAINFTKLDHFNGLHIRGLDIADLTKRIKPFFIEKGLAVDDAILLKITPIIQERIATLDEAVDMAGFFFKDDVQPKPDELIAKDLTATQSADVIKQVLAILDKLPDVALQNAEPPLRAFVDQSGLSAGQVFGMIRVAVTGQKISPPLFESMEIIGKEKVVARLQRAVELLEK
jgi:glutamyl-tRNA synthetase